MEKSFALINANIYTGKETIIYLPRIIGGMIIAFIYLKKLLK